MELFAGDMEISTRDIEIPFRDIDISKKKIKGKKIKVLKRFNIERFKAFELYLRIFIYKKQ